MRKLLTIFVALFLLTSGIAVAQESDSPEGLSEDLLEEEQALSFTYDPEQFRLFYHLGVAGEALCTDGEIAEACEAVDVVGPNGQVNHGTLVSAFNKYLPPGQGRGCLIRQIAKAGFGKGDQQVKAESDGNSDAASEDEAATLEEEEAAEIAAEAAEKIDYRAFCQMKKERKEAKGKKAEGFIPPGQAKKQDAAASDD